ncbi:hypothetical protein AB0G74_30520 [Streptomyces sp. NPDC020875]|uniref:hypothetical protein n=1 Tax=Streptomyces sp. NPDC020875 TaxID=3154898 RepID=UPI0033F3B413
MNEFPLIPQVLGEPDPARRLRAAIDASALAAATRGHAAAAPYEKAAQDALEELIAAHGGNVAAAARETGFDGRKPLTPQALHKRRQKAKGQLPASSPAASPRQAQPALHFNNPLEAEDALEDWALRRQEVDDQRDTLLLGALAAGVDPARIAELAPAGLDLLRRIRPAGNITVSQLKQDAIEEFARAIAARADELRALDTPAAQAAARIWRLAADDIVTNTAPYALHQEPVIRVADYDTPEAYADAVMAARPETDHDEGAQREPSHLSMVAGPDAWLAWYYLQLARDAAREPVEGTGERGEAVTAAFGDLAEAILHLRTTGQVPPALTHQARPGQEDGTP